MKNDQADTYAMDENKKIYKVRTNFMGQKVREAYSLPRVLTAFVLYFVILAFVRSHITNWIAIIAIALVLLFVIKALVLNVVVSSEELKRYKKTTS